MPTLHQLSPELVLVDPDLREAAIAALPDRICETYGQCPPRAATRRLSEASEGRGGVDRSMIAGAVLYAAWHALLGAVLVCGAVFAAALALLALGYAAG